MSDVIAVRQARVEDAENIAQIQVRTWQTAYRGILHDHFLDHLGENMASRTERRRARVTQRDPNVTFVAESDTEGILGFATGGPDRVESALAEIYAIYVTPIFHRRGVGRKLVHVLAQQFWARGTQSMRVWVLTENRSRRFYERLGGQVQSVRMVTIGGKAVEETAYVTACCAFPRLAPKLVIEWDRRRRARACAGSQGHCCVETEESSKACATAADGERQAA